MNSERTRLSGAALDVLSLVASGLGADFEPLLSLFFPSLLSLCGRTNKVVVTRAKACILAIVEVTQLPAILAYFIQFARDKSPTVRLVVAEGTLCCLKCFNPPDLEQECQFLAIETIIRNSVRDANADIRKVGKDIFQSYKLLLPSRVESFVTPLTPTIRKYLQLAASNTGMQSRTTSAASSRSKLIPKSVPEPPKTQGLETRVEPVRPTKASTLTAKPGAPSQRQDSKPAISKPSGPLCHRAASTSAHSSGPQPTSGPTKQLPISRKLPPGTVPSTNDGTATASRNLTRPTLSQLARIRPPVVRPPVSKPVKGLDIRKAKPPAGPRPAIAVAAPARKPNAIKAQVPRPTTPSAIPLPPSPKLLSNKPSTPISGPTDEITSDGINDLVIASTPVADTCIPNINLALKTPISTLLSSIQQGFDLTPCSPLSPPQDYLASPDPPLEGGPFKLGVIRPSVFSDIQS
ncbi:Protein stu-1 [Leucoagaricus sp. SymC.cos]|nr:Protein stu-1 [Leucoagaricus sp. SymC.cos]